MSNKFRAVLMLTAAALMFISPSAFAQDKPIQLSLFAPVQLFPEETAISGIRLSLLYGKNTTVTGLDWGLVNHTTAGQSKGVQFGGVSIVEADFMGWQDGWVNVVKGNFEGFQSGMVNHAKYVHGLQLGFVNYARSMRGLQIGLVNIIGEGGQFPIFPIINWSF